MSLSGDDCCISNWDLWQAIKNVPLPEFGTPKEWSHPSKAETFQQRLSSQHDLTEESARRLVEEYRRFLYLKAIDGGSLTPSERVDQAWHLHMEAAGEGWARFCDEVLKSRIGHRTGLSKEETKASYARLFELYRREFNREPPSDIWPGERERKQKAIGSGMAFAGGAFFGLSALLGELHVGGSGPFVGALVGLALILIGIVVLTGTDLETVAGGD